MPLKYKYLIIAGVACVGLFAVTAGVIHYTSRTEFCLSCHEMDIYQQEQAVSPHAKDYEGKEIGCSKCHIPATNPVRMITAKSWMGGIDIYMHLTGQAENLDRLHMQGVARRFTDDANCRACHEDLTKNAKKDGPNSDEGLLAHDNFMGKNGQSRRGCVGCHQNLAHLPKFDERLPKNKEFAERLKEVRR